jgi:hypothetical protein
MTYRRWTPHSAPRALLCCSTLLVVFADVRQGHQVSALCAARGGTVNAEGRETGHSAATNIYGAAHGVMLSR